MRDGVRLADSDDVCPIGSVIICVATFVSAIAMFGALNAAGLLRVSKDGELRGLDIDQYGISAYREHVINPT